jgi:hypothetical protein
MSEYYKIKYTIHGDAAKIRSVILSCVNADVATDNFKMAFIGQSPSIESIEWIRKRGSMVVSALALMEEPSPTAELVPMPEPEAEESQNGRVKYH